MSLAIARHRPFIEETFQLVSGALGAQQLVFYAVDRDSNLRDFVTQAVPRDMHERYQRRMFAFDPLHVRRIAGHERPLARWRDAAHYAPAEHVALYTRYLRRYAVVDALELIFRDGPTIVAGLNVAWTEHDRRPTQAKVTLARQLQRYVEFCLNSRLRNARKDWLESARALGLTPRESEIAQLVCQGHTNHAIATCLDIGTSTVKSHLLRIFEKCQVDSRAGLVGRLSDASC